MMIPPAFLALVVAGHPIEPSQSWPSPPEEVVDFLGRRRLCLDLSEPSERTAFAEEEWTRLRCTELAQEEAAYRSRFASDRDALRWFDQDPNEFQLPGILVNSYDGPPSAEARRLRLDGVAMGGRPGFRLAADVEADGGRYTTFAVSFADLPQRIFAMENARFPWVDLQSLRVFLGGNSPNDRLLVEFRYGYTRGYCADHEADDRPRVSIAFTRTEVSASSQDRVNCRTDYEALPNAAAASD